MSAPDRSLCAPTVTPPTPATATPDWRDLLNDLNRCEAENERQHIQLVHIERTAEAANALRGDAVYLASAHTNAFQTIANMAAEGQDRTYKPKQRPPAPAEEEQDEPLVIISAEEDLKIAIGQLAEARTKLAFAEGRIRCLEDHIRTLRDLTQQSCRELQMPCCNDRKALLVKIHQFAVRALQAPVDVGF